MSELTLIIPAKNESESLPIVLEEIKNYDVNIKVLLQKDDIETINSIKNFNCEIIHQINRGYGDALIHGINLTNTKYFCIFNADGSFKPEELNGMLDLSTNHNYDLIFGSRYEQDSSSEDDTLITFIGNKIFSLIGKIFFSLPISDILYTFVLGKTKKVNDLNLTSKDFCFCVELPIKAYKNNLNLISSPANERKRIAGTKKVNAFKDGFKILISMIKLKFS